VNDSWLEFILTLFSLWLVLLIISPLFIMFIDYDSILLSSLLVYSLGYQWSWSFNLNGVFTYSLSDNYSSFFKNGIKNYSFVLFSRVVVEVLSANFSFRTASQTLWSWLAIALGERFSFNFLFYSDLSTDEALHGTVNSRLNSSLGDSFEYVLINVSFDHFLVPTLSLLDFSLFMNSVIALSDDHFCWLAFAFGSCSLFVDYLVYFISLNSILLLPCFLGFRFLIFSFDVIHSLGFYSLGFKMDAIPGRINYSFELSTLFKGEHRGFCYELCGTSHSSMLILALSL